MLSQKRLESLKTKSALLAQQVEKEEHSPSADPTILRHLKKKKLEIKEIIEGVRSDSGTLH